MAEQKKKSLLQTYLDELRRNNIERMTSKSREWFMELLSVGELKTSFAKVAKDPAVKSRSRPMIGKMYMYIYDPKTKAALPYWDRYPLIIMADLPEKGKGWYGLNLHYLSPLLRAKLLDGLMQYSSTGKTLKETTKLRLSYGLLKSARKHRLFKPTFKRYLPEHVKSKIVEIPAPLWEICMFLPTQKFVGTSTNTVWNDSKKIGR